MKRKFLSMVVILAMLLSMMPFSEMTSYAITEAVSLFYDDFESYAEGSYPTTFTLKYDGSGDENQKVISTEDYSGTTGKVFQLAGVSSWASEQYVPLVGELPEKIIIDAYIKPVTSSRNAELALRNLDVGSWGTRISSIWFEGDGTIKAVQNGNDADLVGIGTYSVGEWYRITLDNDFLAKTYDVYIDGIIAKSNIPMHQSLSPTVMSLIAHNIAPSIAYFDNVGIYTELPDFSIELPFATNVAISGSAIVGETLSGEYDFNGTSESGSTYRWLREDEQMITSIHSTAGVSNNPPNPSIITLSTETHITRIITYHYYNGGTPPGTIALKNVGDETVFGPWNAVGSDGQGGVANAYWTVSPNIILPAGDYEVVDSDRSTWSWVTGDGRGMVYVYGDVFTPIDSATEKSYVLTSGDLGKMIKFEVTVRDSSGLTGNAIESGAVGPVIIPTPEPGTIQFDASGYGTYEGYDGWIRVERIDGSDGIVSVDYSTVDDTAIADIHYTPVSGTLTWSDGDNESKFIRITVANDSQYNGYLYLKYTLSNPTGGVQLGSKNPLSVKLSDDDNPPTPTGFKASPGNGQVTLEWDEVISAYYKLYYSTSQAGFTEDNSIRVSNATSHTFTGLTNGTPYYFAVKAGHNNYFSELTDTISVTPKAPSSGRSSYTPPPIIVNTEENNGTTTNSTKLPSSTASGTASANVTNAIIDALLNKIDTAGGSGKNDLIELNIDTETGIDELRVSILHKDLAEIIQETDARLGVTSSFISIIFDAKALETISEAESGGTVVISAGIIDISTLSASDQAKVKDRPVYDLNVVNGDTKVSNFNGGHATVSIPYTIQPDENPNAIVIYHLADDGTLKPIRGYYDATLKSVVFKTTHFSHFAIGYNPVGFGDVAADSWYKNAVDFIAARGITSGIGENQYGPEAKLTRAQFVVLLMNAYQISTQNQGESDQIQNFTDAGSTYYTDYLMTAKALGIIKGVGNNLFAPDKDITRQEMFVMLYNALKVIDEVPVASSSKELSSFDDANQVSDWAFVALSNLVKAGVVSGSNNNVSPTSGTTRAEIAQVLYNLLSK